MGGIWVPRSLPALFLEQGADGATRKDQTGSSATRERCQAILQGDRVFPVRLQPPWRLQGLLRRGDALSLALQPPKGDRGHQGRNAGPISPLLSPRYVEPWKGPVPPPPPRGARRKPTMEGHSLMLGLKPGSLVSCHPHTEGTRLNCRWHLGMPCGESDAQFPCPWHPRVGKPLSHSLSPKPFSPPLPPKSSRAGQMRLHNRPGWGPRQSLPHPSSASQPPLPRIPLTHGSGPTGGIKRRAEGWAGPGMADGTGGFEDESILELLPLPPLQEGRRAAESLTCSY